MRCKLLCRRVRRIGLVLESEAIKRFPKRQMTMMLSYGTMTSLLTLALVSGLPGQAQLPPRLQEVYVTETFTNVPPSVRSPIVVSEIGEVAFATSADEPDGQITILTRDGAIKQNFGRRGNGPGEFRDPRVLYLTNSEIGVIDQNRYLRLSHDGRLLQSYPLPSNGLITSGRPGLVLGLVMSGGAMRPVMFVVDRADRIVTRQLGADSVLIATAANVGPRSPSILVTGASDERLVVGNPFSYSAIVYDTSGLVKKRLHRSVSQPRWSESRLDTEVKQFLRTRERMGARADEVAAKQIRAQLSSAPLPFFSAIASPGFDHQGRLWFLRQDGDVLYGDVHWPNGAISEVLINCSGFAGMAAVVGEYLAVVCASDSNNYEADTSLRLIRIRG